MASSTDTPASNLGGGLGGLQHLTVYGSLTTTPIGVFLGGDPNGEITNKTYFGDNIRFDDVVVLGFTTGIQFGNNAFTDTFVNMRLESNSRSMYAPSAITGSGEKMVISNSQFVNETQGIDDENGMEWMIDNSTFDEHTGVAITVAGAYPNANHLNIIHSHFENTSNITLASGGYISNRWRVILIQILVSLRPYQPTRTYIRPVTCSVLEPSSTLLTFSPGARLSSGVVVILQRIASIAGQPKL